MDTRDRGSLERFVREHHVHYDVEPREASQARDRQVVGFDLRLLATHGESKLEAPACPRCVELLTDLESFAREIVSSADAATWADVVPEPAALYQSTEVQGADEVALTIHLLREAPDGEGAAGRETRAGSADRGAQGEDPHLQRMREALEKLGVLRRP